MAASALVVIPVIVLFFFAQRLFIQGIAITGLKG
jgi:multiple sugar transport system permease protein